MEGRSVPFKVSNLSSHFPWLPSKDSSLRRGCVCSKLPRRWVEEHSFAAVLFCLVTIFLGVGLYGASVGLWQGGRQAVYLSIKLPWVILLTLGTNALLNGILARLLGIQVGLRQTTLALLSAFAVFALIVGALSPVTIGIALDAPPPDSELEGKTHRHLILVHAGIIVFAGIISTGRLHSLLIGFSKTKSAAR